jgi:hypothetical protein
VVAECIKRPLFISKPVKDSNHAYVMKNGKFKGKLEKCPIEALA